MRALSIRGCRHGRALSRAWCDRLPEATGSPACPAVREVEGWTRGAPRALAGPVPSDAPEELPWPGHPSVLTRDRPAARVAVSPPGPTRAPAASPTAPPLARPAAPGLPAG